MTKTSLTSLMVLVFLLCSGCRVDSPTPSPSLTLIQTSTPNESNITSTPTPSLTLIQTGTPNEPNITSTPTPSLTLILTGTPSEPNLTITATTPSEDPVTRLSTLPITFPIMSPKMADYFNQIARPDDYALIPMASRKYLPLITSGQIRVVFPSWALAEQELPGLINTIGDVASYNPEHWERTPLEEQVHLPETVAQAAQFSHDLGLKLSVAPDRRFAREYLSEIAAHADMIGLQGQRLQNDPQSFETWMREMITIARDSNPQVLIFVQVGATQGSATQMLTAIQSIAYEIDGISIWSNNQTFPILQEFISMIRPSQ